MKNIVICCDGTANQFGKNNTNVVKIYEMIVEDVNQPNFYDPGVGTTSRSALLPLRWLSNKISQGLGLDLGRNVEDAYSFLMNTYEDGDQIFLFGFSRGAHTVRRLADVLWKLGLLYKGSENMTPYVLRIYEKDEEQNIIDSFKKTYTRKCPVHFLGVWDTVSALSKLMPNSKLDGILSDEITHAYHAVSIDERRLLFPANLFEKKERKSQKVEEVWFAGVHSDVGGYYNESELSDITLEWMIEKAELAGLQFYSDHKKNLRPNPICKLHNSWDYFFKFVPWHVYALLSLGLLLILQIFISYLSIFWPNTFSVRPFNFILIKMIDYWYITLFLILTSIPFTKRSRNIPEGAWVHNSVKKRNELLGYNPKNLEKVFKSVNWV